VLQVPPIVSRVAFSFAFRKERLSMHPNHVRLTAIDPVKAKNLFDVGLAVLVDVREEDEWRTEHIPGAILNPLSQFEAARVPANGGRKVILYCHGGARSPKAADLLYRAGHMDLMHLRGGLTGWKQAGMAIERVDSSSNGNEVAFEVPGL
jgi:rhodanese-related sulfurtransferase